MARSSLFRNVTAALSVSFVALSLGAAFGILSGRGALAGMVSAAIIPIVTSSLGGTRVQLSGPTAPMTAVTAVVVAFARDKVKGYDPDWFISVVLLESALLLLAAAAARAGKLITLVPNVVISGFMNGIASLIWIDQIKRLSRMQGALAINIGVAALTLALVVAIPRTLRRWARFVPATLAAIVVVTAISIGLAVERVTLAPIDTSVVARMIPRAAPLEILVAALPWAGQLAMLAYLDTLMTALVVDRLTGEKTKPNQELAAQGLAVAAVMPVGGIPGAQATIRSVLAIKEGATERWVGVLVGVFCLVEMLLLQPTISLIPQAVFTGVLFKVGWDVFDFAPLRGYFRREVGHVAMAIILLTTLVTILVNLNVAVIALTLVFYLVRRFYRLKDI